MAPKLFVRLEGGRYGLVDPKTQVLFRWERSRGKCAETGGPRQWYAGHQGQGWEETKAALEAADRTLAAEVGSPRALEGTIRLLKDGGWSKLPEECLGKGKFGSVWKARDERTGRLFAVKQLLKSSPQSHYKDLKNEETIMRQLNHPNIIQCYGTDEDEESHYLLMELADCSLSSCCRGLVGEPRPLEELRVRRYSRQILLALAHIHKQGIMHRDIKARNIVLHRESDCVKLVDFGAAKMKANARDHDCLTNTQGRGTPIYSPPEQINSAKYDLSVDIWALGCTVIELLTGDLPWKDLKTGAAPYIDQNGQLNLQAALIYIGAGRNTPPLPDSLSEKGKDFLKLCLQRKPERRASAETLLRHPFVDDADIAADAATTAAAAAAAAAEPASIVSPEPVSPPWQAPVSILWREPVSILSPEPVSPVRLGPVVMAGTPGTPDAEQGQVSVPQQSQSPWQKGEVAPPGRHWEERHRNRSLGGIPEFTAMDPVRPPFPPAGEPTDIALVLPKRPPSPRTPSPKGMSMGMSPGNGSQDVTGRAVRSEHLIPELKKLPHRVPWRSGHSGSPVCSCSCEQGRSLRRGRVVPPPLNLGFSRGYEDSQTDDGEQTPTGWKKREEREGPGGEDQTWRQGPFPQISSSPESSRGSRAGRVGGPHSRSMSPSSLSRNGSNSPVLGEPSKACLWPPSLPLLPIIPRPDHRGRGGIVDLSAAGIGRGWSGGHAGELWASGSSSSSDGIPVTPPLRHALHTGNGTASPPGNWSQHSQHSQHGRHSAYAQYSVHEAAHVVAQPSRNSVHAFLSGSRLPLESGASAESRSPRGLSSPRLVRPSPESRACAGPALPAISSSPSGSHQEGPLWPPMLSRPVLPKALARQRGHSPERAPYTEAYRDSTGRHVGYGETPAGPGDRAMQSSRRTAWAQEQHSGAPSQGTIVRSLWGGMGATSDQLPASVYSHHRGYGQSVGLGSMSPMQGWSDEGPPEAGVPGRGSVTAPMELRSRSGEGGGYPGQVSRWRQKQQWHAREGGSDWEAPQHGAGQGTGSLLERAGGQVGERCLGSTDQQPGAWSSGLDRAGYEGARYRGASYGNMTELEQGGPAWVPEASTAGGVEHGQLLSEQVAQSPRLLSRWNRGTVTAGHIPSLTGTPVGLGFSRSEEKGWPRERSQTGTGVHAGRCYAPPKEPSLANGLEHAPCREESSWLDLPTRPGSPLTRHLARQSFIAPPHLVSPPSLWTTARSIIPIPVALHP